MDYEQCVEECKMDCEPDDFGCMDLCKSECMEYEDYEDYEEEEDEW